MALDPQERKRGRGTKTGSRNENGFGSLISSGDITDYQSYCVVGRDFGGCIPILNGRPSCEPTLPGRGGRRVERRFAVVRVAPRSNRD
jgi:hypothetical protein